ncbi:PhoX family protein [Malikia spinosa]|uniref:PhoX family phosphatase n=1 Tax=Malikia spinosa TaxID=86180 RepID=A0A7C9IX40_9BURK|nr:PhoX family phosphatase [Malikia spinosa]MYZ52029.1 PhoX family phosphatase [Malikia spinosa]
MANHNEEMCNFSNNEHFQDVLERSAQAGISRRNLIRGGMGLAALSTVPFLSACGGGDDAPAEKALSFSAVGKSLADNVILPAGYTYTVVHATGDRLVSSIPAYSNKGLETDEWTMRVGDHHDGMEMMFIGADGKFTTTDTGRAVLAVNHESSADSHFWHVKGQTSNGVSGKKFTQFGDWDLGTRPELEVLKEINHHGVSLVEVTKGSTGWTYKLDSLYNRRVTAQTPMRIAGPAAHLADIKALMVTAFDTTGATSRGTLNNCGTGATPWGTMLTGEENWAFYFNMPKGSNPVDDKIKASRARYGVARNPIADAATAASGQGWYTPSATDNRFSRWDISARGASAAADFRNEPNTFGYNVEIDPLTNSTPVKRIAMGRFAHEAAAFSVPVAGKPLAVYQGCDSQNEYIYKFVSAANWDPKDVGGGLAAGDKYLNEGKLYAAKFNADGTGQWLELTITDPKISGYSAYKFANQADVYVNARHAADAVGATKMDRPEWGTVNPANGEIYFALTNNSSRTPARVDAANPRSYNDVDGNKRSGNPNGHIIRFKDKDSLASATAFTWDIFLLGAEEDAGAGINLSGLTANNALSSPDGLKFGEVSGVLWIQTDDGAYTDETNCMLLAAIPGTVGDGKKVTVDSSLIASGTTTTAKVDTFIGATLGDAKLRRFLVGPKGCEVTGLVESPDGKTLFVNIQHPGETTPAIGTAAEFTFQSQWPGNQGYGVAGRPRSATIAISRTDGGKIIG